MEKSLQYVATVEPSGFVAGLQQMGQAMESVRRLFAEITSGAATNAGATAGSIAQAQQYTQAIRAQATAQQQFLQSLQQRVATQGMDPAALLRYQAAQLGVAHSAEALIDKIDQAAKATQAKAAADAKAAQVAREQQQALREQQQAASALASSQQSFLSSLQTQIDTHGMNAAALLRYRATQLGVGEQAEVLISKLQAQGQAGATSARQMANAMRMLPMQMTDVVTSLASGMPLWMVLIQQGGQIKDSFGGIGPMFQGLGQGIKVAGAAILANPVTSVLTTLAVVSIGAAVAFAKGQSESNAFAVALRNTGNAAGLTSTSYERLTRTAQEATGASIGAARDAAAAAAASGEFGAAAIGPAITAITAYAKATGKTAEEAAANFKGIGRDVTRWAEEQNRSLNFLTIEIYNHIRSLQEQGRAQEAAAVAMQAMTRHLTEQPQHLGWIERAARAAGNALSDFWDKAKGLGRAETVGDQLDAVGEKLKALESHRPQQGVWMWRQAEADWQRERAVLTERQAALQEQQRTEQRAASLKAEQAEKTARAIEATKAIDQQRDQTASPAQKREKELAEYRRHAAALKAVGQEISADQQRKDEAAIAGKYKDPKSSTAEKSRMGQFEQQLAEERRLASEKDAIRGMTQQQELAYWQRIASVEKMSATDRVSVQRKVSDLKTQILRSDAQQAQQLADIELQGKQAAQMAEVDLAHEAARQRQQIGQISQQALLQQEIGFEQRRTAIRKQALEQQAGQLDPALDVVKIAQLRAQIDQVERQGAARVGQIRGQIAADAKRIQDAEQDRKLKSWEDTELAKVQIEEEASQRALTLGEITRAQQLQREAEFEQRRLAIKRQTLAAQIDTSDPSVDPTRHGQLLSQIEQVEMQHQQRMAQIRGQAAIEQQSVWTSAKDKMSGLWDQGVTSMMNGTLTWRNAQKAVGAEVVRWFLVDVVKKKVLGWIMGEQATTGATVLGVAARGVAEKGGAAQSVALWALTATRNIMSSAWEAMAAAWKAVVGIPYVGPVLAVGAAAAAFAGVSALASKVKSARGGYDIPAGVNPMTQLHEEEMVLPAQHANTIRSLGGLVPALSGPRLPIPEGDPMRSLHAPVSAAQASPGSIASGAVQSVAQAMPRSDSYSVPVTYNDHSGRLSPDDIRRNSNLIGDIVNNQIRLNRIKG